MHTLQVSITHCNNGEVFHSFTETLEMYGVSLYHTKHVTARLTSDIQHAVRLVRRKGYDSGAISHHLIYLAATHGNMPMVRSCIELIGNTHWGLTSLNHGLIAGDHVCLYRSGENVFSSPEQDFGNAIRSYAKDIIEYLVWRGCRFTLQALSQCQTYEAFQYVSQRYFTSDVVDQLRLPENRYAGRALAYHGCWNGCIALLVYTISMGYAELESNMLSVIIENDMSNVLRVYTESADLYLGGDFVEHVARFKARANPLPQWFYGVAIHAAVVYGRVETLRYLLRLRPDMIVNLNIFDVITSGQYTVLNTLISVGYQLDVTPQHYLTAVLGNQLKMLRQLVEADGGRGMDIAAMRILARKCSVTFLHWAYDVGAPFDDSLLADYPAGWDGLYKVRRMHFIRAVLDRKVVSKTVERRGVKYTLHKIVKSRANLRCCIM